MMLMAAFTISFAACEKSPEPQPEPGPVQPEGLTFEIEIENVTKSSMTFSITPSDLEAEYLCMLYDAETVEDFTKDEYLVATLFQELTAEAASMGKTFSEYMPEFVDKGAIESATFTNLAPQSDYYLLVFGVDAANNYQACTEVIKNKFTTLEAPMLECTFDVTTEVQLNAVKLNVKPSDKEAMWHLFIMPAAQYDFYVNDPEGYQMSPTTLFTEYLNSEIQQLLGAGYTEQQVIDALFLVGDQSLEAKGLSANTEYLYVVAGLSGDSEGTYVSTDIFTGEFRTGEAAKSDMTFNISVTDIEAMRAAIKIVPSKGNETFCWMCGAYDGESSAEEVMNSIVEMYGGWMNNGAMLYKGTQDFTGGPGSSYKYKLDAPDTEYYVLAFGYAGGVTTLPEMVTFRTLPGADPMEVEFSMVASNITPYSANISVKVSDESVYYTGSAISPEAYNKEELVAAFNEDFDYILEMSQEMDPNTTVANVLRTYYWNGSQELGATGLLPETELMGFIFALDTKTGHVARVIEFPGLATTSSLGDVVPSIELVGYYSGDDEAGAIFGQPAATKGKAITVVKYDNFEGARMLFTTLIEGDCTSVTAYPDTDMWAFSAGYWSNCKVSEPYTFYVSDWETEYTAMVYATDSNGNIGSFGRLYTVATAENKGDIEELKELYNSLADSSKYAAKSSVVVGEPRQNATPVITNITPAKAAVAAPAVEEVREEVAVELPSMVMVEKVAPFRFRK